MRATERYIRRGQGKRQPKIVRISDEVDNAGWLKKRSPQALRNMRADREETMETEEGIYVEMWPRVRQRSV
jgi:hypothetical protein